MKQVSRALPAGATVVFALAAVLPAGAVAAAPPATYAHGYTLTEVGWSSPLHFQTALSQINAINDAGTLVGEIGFRNHGGIGATTATVGGFSSGYCGDVVETGQCSSWDTAINAAGQVAGVQEVGFASPQIATGTNAGHHAFLFAGGATTDLGTLGGTSSFTTGINRRGWVVGTSDIAANARQDIFLYRNGSMRDMGVGQAVGINARGQIAGNEGSGSALRAFVMGPSGGHRWYLGSPASPCTQAAAINDRGAVVGVDCTGSAPQAFTTARNGVRMRNLGALAGGWSTATAVNNAGQIGGASGVDPQSGAEHAFLWDGAVLLDLNALIDPADPLQSSVTLTGVVAINDRGQIIATGTGGPDPAATQFLVSPPPLVQQLVTLQSMVAGGRLGRAVSGTVTQAQSYYTAGDVADACVALNAVLDELADDDSRDPSGRLVHQLDADVRVILDTLGCAIRMPDGEREERAKSRPD